MSNTPLDPLYKIVTGPLQTTPRPIAWRLHTYTERPITWRQPKYNYNLNDVDDVLRHADYNLPSYKKVVSTAPVPMGLKYKKYDDIPNKESYINPPNKVRNDKLREYPAASSIMDKRTRSKSIYETDVKDTAKWLYKRKGHDLTDELWEGIQKARLSPRSALRHIPENIYYFSSDDETAAIHAYKEGNTQEYIPFINMNPENPMNDLQGSPYEKINGYIRYTDDLSNARDLYSYGEILDHELSHAFNLSQYDNVMPDMEFSQRHMGWEKMLEHIPDNYSIFAGPFKQSNPDITELEQYYLFDDTYIMEPLEYLGAMARIKRLAAGDGYDVFNEDDKIARDGMSRTLHRIATETNPEHLPYEMQRIHTWVNTSFDNYFDIIQKYRDLMQQNNPLSEDLIRLDNILKNRKQMELDPNSPLYQNILRYLTPETLRALVHNNPNTQSLNNIHLT